MKTLTFDWNCVISAEKRDGDAAAVDKLVELHRLGSVEVALTTVSASESLQGSKTFQADGRLFEERLERLGWTDLTIERGPSVIGLTHIGMSTIVDSKFEAERDALWSVIGGSVPHRLPDDIGEQALWSPSYKKWRNVWCDVHTLWTHIKSGRDVFVTTNSRDFQGNAEELKQLGLKEVLTPKEAVQSLGQ